MRISFPGDYEPDIRTVPGFEDKGGEANVGTQRSLQPTRAWKEGAYVEFFDLVMRDFGVTTYEIVGLSEAARRHSTSDYTQCAYEIALNNTDVCIGPTWPTEERQCVALFWCRTAHVRCCCQRRHALAGAPCRVSFVRVHARVCFLCAHGRL